MNTMNNVQEEQPLLPTQQYWFDIDSPKMIEMERFNSDALIKVNFDIDLDILNRVIRTLVQKHDILRATFHKTEDRGWIQLCAKEANNPPIRVFDLSNCNPADYIRQVETHCKEIQNTEPFNLQTGPLVKSFWFYGPGKKDNFFWIYTHHLLLDGISVLLIPEEIFRLYKQIAAGEEPTFPQVKDSSQKFVPDFLDQYFKKDDPGKDPYWINLPVKDLAHYPIEQNRHLSENTIQSLDSITTFFDEKETEVLIQCKQHLGIPISLHDMLLCSIGNALLSWTGGKYVDIEVFDSGRKFFEEYTGLPFSKNLGWFALSRHILFNECNDKESYLDKLSTYYNQLRNISNKGFGFNFLKTYRTKLDPIKNYKNPPFLFNFFGRVRLQLKSMDAERVFIDTGYFQNPANRYSHLISATGYIAFNKLGIDWRFSSNLFNKSTIEDLINYFNDFIKFSLLLPNRKKIEDKYIKVNV